jgi:site-specific recombinase XerD
MSQRPTLAHLDEFLTQIDIARKTETTYRYGLQTFAEFLATKSNNHAAVVDTSRLGADSLTQYRHWMRHERGLSRRSEGTYMAAAIRYVEWLDANGLFKDDITSSKLKLNLRNSRGRRRVGYKTQPIKEAVPLILQFYDLAPLPSANTPRGRRQRLTVLRNRAIVHTLMGTGLRAQELASLRRSDCADGVAEKMLITGKGEKERFVVLNTEAKGAIKAYLLARDADRNQGQKRPTLPDTDEPLFIRHDRDRTAPMSTKTVWLVVSQAARKLGLSTRISPHDFRRYMATTLLSEGMPLESVQAFLGHESIVTTRTVYAHTRSEVLDDQLKSYRPRISDLLRRARQDQDDNGGAGGQG